jgi:1-deoxy-D-xylulose-5-phosphate reductoisomerase
VVVLGSTGSVGTQALDVMASHPDLFEVVGLAAGSDRDGVERQAASASVADRGVGEDVALRLATKPEADIVLNAIVGVAGLRASVAALEAGKVLALANKESLVAGGQACLAAARRGGGTIRPVDSEHAAVAQCLEGRDRASIRRIVLTASGGPFRTRRSLDGVTVDDALAHPTWSMGPKITIDCATLMNKGLEVIEAYYLFGLPYDAIDVLVHPQSVVHGIVELVDGSMLAQAAVADMRIPIQAALAAPERLTTDYGRVDFANTGALTFERVDDGRFPAVALAYEAGTRGDSYPAALNAANEVAVHAFLSGRIGFTNIVAIVRDVLDHHDPTPVDDVDAVLEVDRRARAAAQHAMEAATVAT